MTTTQLGNCPKCGKLYMRIRSICNECYQKQEDDFLKTAKYLRDHRGSTIQELSEDTGVTITQIRQFIWAGRIIVNQFPNLSYPCESCGSPIQTGRKCSSCLDTLNQLANHAIKTETETKSQLNGSMQNNKGLRLITRSNLK